MTVKEPRPSICHVHVINGADLEYKCNRVCEEETALGYLLFKTSCASCCTPSRQYVDTGDVLVTIVLAFRKMYPEEHHRYVKEAKP